MLLEDLLDVVWLEPHATSDQTPGNTSRIGNFGGRTQCLDQHLDDFLIGEHPQGFGEHRGEFSPACDLLHCLRAIGAQVHEHGTDPLAAEEVILDQAAQRVVEPDPQNHLQLPVGTSLRRLLHEHDHGGTQRAVFGEADPVVRPQPVSIEPRDVGQRVVAASVTVAAVVARSLQGEEHRGTRLHPKGSAQLRELGDALAFEECFQRTLMPVYRRVEHLRLSIATRS